MPERDDRLRKRLFREAKFKYAGAGAAEVIFGGKRGLIYNAESPRSAASMLAPCRP